MKLDANNPADARLERLLDETLSPASIPGGLPAELAGRILARTAGLLPAATRPERPDVAARIGPGQLAAMAATLLLALGAGVWMTAQRAALPADPIAVAELRLESLASLPVADDALDQEIALLAMRVDSAAMYIDDGDYTDVNRALDESEFELRVLDAPMF